MLSSKWPRSNLCPTVHLRPSLWYWEMQSTVSLGCPGLWGSHLETALNPELATNVQQCLVWHLQEHEPPCLCSLFQHRVTLLLPGSKGEVNIAGSDPETQEYVLHLKESHCGKSEPYSKINQSNILCFVRDMNSLLYVSFFSSVGTASSSLIAALLSSSLCSKSVKQQNS